MASTKFCRRHSFGIAKKITNGALSYQKSSKLIPRSLTTLTRLSKPATRYSDF